MTDTKNYPHGLAPNFIAPFSGKVTKEMAADTLATLPAAKVELHRRWGSINVSRLSGFCIVAEGGPLDDAVREGVWQPSLQVDMPTAGGLPGSRGVKQPWPYHQTEARPAPESSSWDSGGGFASMHGVGSFCGKGQTVFRVWTSSNTRTKAWSENG